MYRGFERREYAPQEYIVLNGERIGGRWVCGDLLQDNIIVPHGQQICVVFGVIDDYMDAHDVLPETVCAYTGINDRDGNPVYEGDIVGMPDQVVRYVNCGYEVGPGKPLWIWAPDCSVIGNIFEE